MLKEIAEGKEPPSSEDFGLAIKVRKSACCSIKRSGSRRAPRIRTLFARSSKVQDASFGSVIRME